VNRRKVLIKIIEAKNLMKVDLIGQPSPFVALDMNGHEKDVKQTSVKKDTVNPAWGEEFEFTVMDEVNDVLVLHISDFHKLRANTFMGVAHIPIMPLTLLKAPMDYWFDLIDKKALSKATSKKERGAIHVHMTWTDAEGRTWNEPNPSVNPAQHYSAEVLDRAAVRQAEIAERMELQREAEMQTAAQAHQNAGSLRKLFRQCELSQGPQLSFWVAWSSGLMGSQTTSSRAKKQLTWCSSLKRRSTPRCPACSACLPFCSREPTKATSRPRSSRSAITK